MKEKDWGSHFEGGRGGAGSPTRHGEGGGPASWDAAKSMVTTWNGMTWKWSG
jgi:hypothetical protein